MNEVSVFELKQIFADSSDNIIVIDVRRYDERLEGFIANTIHIPLDELSTKMLSMLPKFKDKTVYFQCKSGIRSANATTIFLQAGLSAVNVRGGILAWQDAGFEIIK